MLNFQSPQNILIGFIAILITQFSFTLSQTTTVECFDGFSVQTPAYWSACNDKDFERWICPTASCQKDGHRWVQMQNCVLPGVDGTSTQQCVAYFRATKHSYLCTNAGKKSYSCPYTPINVPHLTCKKCNKPNFSPPSSGAPLPESGPSPPT